MHARGHVGLTLLLMSLLMTPFGYSDEAAILIVLSAAWSTFPDIDLRLGIKHRTVTHTLVFALASGIGFGSLFLCAHGGIRWFGLAFLSGFMGVASHLLGDAFTHHRFKPLRPLSNIEVALRLCSAGNKVVNEGLMVAGGIAFLGYFLITKGQLSLPEIFQFV